MARIDIQSKKGFGTFEYKESEQSKGKGLLYRIGRLVFGKNQISAKILMVFHENLV